MLTFNMVKSLLPAAKQKQDLLKLHTHFMNPLPVQLYNLLRRARPEKATPTVQKMLEKIYQNGSSCSTFLVLLFRFRATIPLNDLIFNKKVAIDLIFLYNKFVLDVEDATTNFQNVLLLKM